jgi:SAM-dependent methyltransferase
MEAASNDGYLLQHYVKEGIPVIGVDPAENIAQIANDKGIYTIPKFFTYQFAQDYRGAVDVFHANNVLAHVADQNNFVNGIAVVLKHSGVAYIEVPYLGKMIEGGYFDQIYHEHLCYFSLSSLNELFIRQGLDIIDADIIPIHGGSLRIAVCHRGAYNKKAKVGIMLASEAFARKPSYYSTFGERVNRQGMEFWRAMEMLRKHHGYGLTIDGYGAAAKGNQFLNYFKVDQKIITQVYDSTPAKQGRFMSNGQIPIVDPNRLEIHKADYVLILAWNFADEIMNKHKTYLMERAFITAYPEFKFWSNKYPRGTIWD